MSLIALEDIHGHVQFLFIITYSLSHNSLSAEILSPFINRSLCFSDSKHFSEYMRFAPKLHARPIYKSNIICKIRNKVQFWVHFLKLPAPTLTPFARLFIHFFFAYFSFDVLFGLRTVDYQSKILFGWIKVWIGLLDS